MDETLWEKVPNGVEAEEFQTHVKIVAFLQLF